MSQQDLSSLVNGLGGAESRRVLDALTPTNSTAAPAVNATYLGQIHVDTTNVDIYIAIKVGDATPANDWVKIYG